MLWTGPSSTPFQEVGLGMGVLKRLALEEVEEEDGDRERANSLCQRSSEVAPPLSSDLSQHQVLPVLRNHHQKQHREDG